MELLWDNCARNGSGGGTVGGGLAFNLLEPKIKGTASINGSDVKIEFTLLSVDIGGSKSAEIKALLPPALGAFGEWSWYVTAKIGEYKFGDFKFSVLNVNVADKGAINDIQVLQ